MWQRCQHQEHPQFRIGTIEEELCQVSMEGRFYDVFPSNHPFHSFINTLPSSVYFSSSSFTSSTLISLSFCLGCDWKKRERFWIVAFDVQIFAIMAIANLAPSISISPPSSSLTYLTPPSLSLVPALVNSSSTWLLLCALPSTARSSQSIGASITKDSAKYICNLSWSRQEIKGDLLWCGWSHLDE